MYYNRIFSAGFKDFDDSMSEDSDTGSVVIDADAVQLRGKCFLLVHKNLILQ